MNPLDELSSPRKDSKQDFGSIDWLSILPREAISVDTTEYLSVSQRNKDGLSLFLSDAEKPLGPR
jgi:hypothetical protein